MAIYQTSYTVEHFHADDGTLLSGGTLEYFIAGTTTPATVYSDPGGTEAGDTITLNDRGEPEVSSNTFIICLSDEMNYKVVAKNASGGVEWTIDNMEAISTSGGSSTEIANADFGQWPEISVNASDTDHDIDFSAGRIADTTGTALLITLATCTKRLDASWSAGTNAGGLFSGTVAADTTYYAFLIESNSDGSIDCGFDTSSTAANIPAGYTKYRRIGSFATDGSANIDSTSVTLLLNAEIAKRGENNGTASLDSAGKVPNAQLPGIELDGTDIYILDYNDTRIIKVDSAGLVSFANGFATEQGPF